MAAEAGAALALVGHSERRHVFGETAEETARKVRAALDAGLVPVLCVGETLEERRAGRAEAVVEGAARPPAGGAPRGGGRRLLVAYEPVWAIGTGETASPDDAGPCTGGARAAGGGVRRGGAGCRPRPLRREREAGERGGAPGGPGVDGVLVGGASLDPRGFARSARRGLTGAGFSLAFIVCVRKPSSRGGRIRVHVPALPADPQRPRPGAGGPPAGRQGGRPRRHGRRRRDRHHVRRPPGGHAAHQADVVAAAARSSCSRSPCR
jgi:hypothetical protein